MKTVELCTNDEYVASDIAPEGWLDEVANIYTSEATAVLDRDPRASHLAVEHAQGQRMLFHGWNGAHFNFRAGCFGTFEALTADEKAALEAADEAGSKAAHEWVAEHEAANAEEYRYTTAGEYRDSTPECTATLTDNDGNDLDDDCPVTINDAEQEYCVGNYDGNQTWISLV